MKTVCDLCPRQCSLSEGQLGFCRARINRGGTIVCENYGRVTSIALDPIEKKPLRMFHPGANILSVGSYGCNMDCGYCQNCEIARADSESVRWDTVSPEELVSLADAYRPQGNIGIAFTYNEPLVGFEFVRDCATLAKQRALTTVLVSNGMVEPRYWDTLIPLIDAANIDLKAFTQDGYRALGGDLETVKNTIASAQGRMHLELTTLIVPEFNDREDEMRRACEWIASLSPEIPLHLSRFFPRHRMQSLDATPVETIQKLARIARDYLKYVFLGNL
ncbi:MAG TPA: AmmeMemoRadiSam system radical SAM enzyme [Clostridia bacterium]|nr:AmmeMemoRadiSam system radical SAM enzyme [Clostridia bacterium]